MFPENTIRIHLKNGSVIEGRLYTIDETTGSIFISKFI